MDGFSSVFSSHINLPQTFRMFNTAYEAAISGPAL
jgi:hypothetical protein